jgi:hypothetical protein
MAIDASRKKCEAMILQPGRAQGAVCFLGGGGDERCCAELMARRGLNEALPFRVFALDNERSLHLLFVSRGSQADCKELSKCLYQTLGLIDVGAPGLTAINYFAVNLIKGGGRMNSLVCIDMVWLMLATIPRWVEADRPADI